MLTTAVQKRQILGIGTEQLARNTDMGVVANNTVLLRVFSVHGRQRLGFMAATTKLMIIRPE